MCAMKSKKLIILAILEILRKYTDEDHRLSQKDIIDILKTEYDMVADRKTVKRNIMDLIDCGYEIECSESLRMMPGRDGTLEETYILSDFYLLREFTDSELRLLIDGLLFSKHIPYSQCKELVGKLSGLSNQYFKSRVRFISTLPENKTKNAMLFYVIEQLDEAIAKGKQVAIVSGNYETDKNLHPRTNPDGTKAVRTVNPYQMAATNGRYYLICNFEGCEGLAHCRLDRIVEISVLDTPVTPPQKVGVRNGLQLPKHMAENLYMFGGESVTVTFRMKKYILNDVIDWFGTDVRFSDETEEEVTARVQVAWTGMRLWAVQYCRHIKILTPTALADEVLADLRSALNVWQN